MLLAYTVGDYSHKYWGGGYIDAIEPLGPSG